MTGYVYFLKPVGQAGPIKVGHSICPMDRLDSLRTWSPIDLEIIASFKGPREIETAIHHRFAHCHLRGEWFEPVAELVSLAVGIRDGGKLEDLVDLSIKTGKLFRRPNTKSPEAKIVGTYKVRVDRARQYASRDMRQVPDAEVKAILEDAGGYRKAYRALTHEEVSILEAFISECRAPRVAA